jgi:hypothetical protein
MLNVSSYTALLAVYLVVWDSGESTWERYTDLCASNYYDVIKSEWAECVVCHDSVRRLRQGAAR